MKKKIIASSKDKEDWIAFTKEMDNISVKAEDLLRKNQKANITPKLDLHGFSLDEANKAVKRFINESFNKGYKKLLIDTGKGSRSKTYINPYLSEKFSMLKYSVPEYIKNDENLSSKISKITKASIQDGGEGAIYIFIKITKKFTE